MYSFPQPAWLALELEVVEKFRLLGSRCESICITDRLRPSIDVVGSGPSARCLAGLALVVSVLRTLPTCSTQPYLHHLEWFTMKYSNDLKSHAAAFYSMRMLILQFNDPTEVELPGV